MKVKEESEKVGLKLNIQKTKIMASGPTTSWEIDGEAVETVSDFILGGLQNHCRWWLQPWNKRRLLLGRKVMTQPAAKSLQSCPTLCESIDGSPPGSADPGILQARALEWVAIFFSNAWKWKWSRSGSSVLGIFQARVLEWVAIAFSMTNLDGILKSRDIAFPTKVHLVKALVFPVVMYGCETIVNNCRSDWKGWYLSDI